MTSHQPATVLRRLAIERAGLPTIAALAKAAGVARTTVYAATAGRSRMSDANAYQVARVLGIGVDQLHDVMAGRLGPDLPDRLGSALGLEVDE